MGGTRVYRQVEREGSLEKARQRRKKEKCKSGQQSPRRARVKVNSSPGSGPEDGEEGQGFEVPRSSMPSPPSGEERTLPGRQIASVLGPFCWPSPSPC